MTLECSFLSVWCSQILLYLEENLFPRVWEIFYYCFIEYVFYTFNMFLYLVEDLFLYAHGS
jgi:hypothetical protein